MPKIRKIQRGQGDFVDVRGSVANPGILGNQNAGLAQGLESAAKASFGVADLLQEKKNTEDSIEANKLVAEHNRNEMKLFEKYKNETDEINDETNRLYREARDKRDADFANRIQNEDVRKRVEDVIRGRTEATMDKATITAFQGTQSRASKDLQKTLSDLHKGVMEVPDSYEDAVKAGKKAINDAKKFFTPEQEEKILKGYLHDVAVARITREIENGDPNVAKDMLTTKKDEEGNDLPNEFRDALTPDTIDKLDRAINRAIDHKNLGDAEEAFRKNPEEFKKELEKGDDNKYGFDKLQRERYFAQIDAKEARDLNEAARKAETAYNQALNAARQTAMRDDEFTEIDKKILADMEAVDPDAAARAEKKWEDEQNYILDVNKHRKAFVDMTDEQIDRFIQNLEANTERTDAYGLRVVDDLKKFARGSSEPTSMGTREGGIANQRQTKSYMSAVATQEYVDFDAAQRERLANQEIDIGTYNKEASDKISSIQEKFKMPKQVIDPDRASVLAKTWTDLAAKGDYKGLSKHLDNLVAEVGEDHVEDALSQIAEKDLPKDVRVLLNMDNPDSFNYTMGVLNLQFTEKNSTVHGIEAALKMFPEGTSKGDALRDVDGQIDNELDPTREWFGESEVLESLPGLHNLPLANALRRALKLEAYGIILAGVEGDADDAVELAIGRQLNDSGYHVVSQPDHFQGDMTDRGFRIRRHTTNTRSGKAARHSYTKKEADGIQRVANERLFDTILLADTMSKLLEDGVDLFDPETGKLTPEGEEAIRNKSRGRTGTGAVTPGGVDEIGGTSLFFGNVGGLERPEELGLDTLGFFQQSSLKNIQMPWLDMGPLDPKTIEELGIDKIASKDAVAKTEKMLMGIQARAVQQGIMNGLIRWETDIPHEDGVILVMETATGTSIPLKTRNGTPVKMMFADMAVPGRIKNFKVGDEDESPTLINFTGGAGKEDLSEFRQKAKVLRERNREVEKGKEKIDRTPPMEAEDFFQVAPVQRKGRVQIIERDDGVERQRTVLSKKQESAFLKWWEQTLAKVKASDPQGRGINPDPDAQGHKYDYRGFWKSKGKVAPDEFKDPDHPNRIVDGVDTITGKRVDR